MPPPPIKTNTFAPLHRSKETDNKGTEMFIEKIGKDLFNPENVKNVRYKLSKDEKAVLKDIRYWDKNVVRVQDRRSRFVVLDNEEYIKKAEDQINRSSFHRLEYDPTKSFEVKVNTWVEKWSQMNILDQKWKSYIQTECSTSGKMYGLIKTHKNNNPARIITSGCNTAIESLSIFVEKVLYDTASNLPSRIKDTEHMLDIIKLIIPTYQLIQYLLVLT